MNNRFKALIADDEPLARERLRGLLAAQPLTVEVIGEASDGDMTLEMIKALSPDVVFLDIQMPGKTGIEVLQALRNPPWVIFVTAYEEFALQAFELSGIDYLVKPVREERLQKSLEKLARIGNIGNQTDAIQNALRMVLAAKEQSKPVAIPVKSGERTFFVKIMDIAYLQAADKYVTLYTKDGKTHLLEQSLNYFEEKIGLPLVRVKREYLINSTMVEDITRYFGGRYILKINDATSTRIITGRSYAETVKRMTEI